MKEEQLRDILLDKLQPSYEKKFGTEKRKNLMNISSLVSGKASYLYHWSAKEVTLPGRKKISKALLRGSSIHALVNQALKDYDSHEITWNLPYKWKDGTENITLIGHYDNVMPVDEKILCEWKSTEQENIMKNGLVLRAKRQIGTYATILRLKTGIAYEAFVVVINSDLNVIKVLPEEIQSGFEFVRKTAIEVAKVLDQ